jgi:hypothetical protein
MNQEQRAKVEKAITGTFMWSFKKGDNIVYNFEIVWELYNAKNNTVGWSNKSKFNKPIIVNLVSIIECILDDFVNRVGQHVHDRVPNITRSQINDFKTKKWDKLEHYIAAARKHNLFDAEIGFYEDLDYLRKARNRVHIQNSKHQLDENEYSIFTNTNVEKVQRVFEQVLERMMTKFFRGDSLQIQFNEVPLPWSVVNAETILEEVDDTPWLCFECNQTYPSEYTFCIECGLPRVW